MDFEGSKFSSNLTTNVTLVSTIHRPPPDRPKSSPYAPRWMGTTSQHFRIDAVARNLEDRFLFG